MVQQAEKEGPNNFFYRQTSENMNCSMQHLSSLQIRRQLLHKQHKIDGGPFCAGRGSPKTSKMTVF